MYLENEGVRFAYIDSEDRWIWICPTCQKDMRLLGIHHLDEAGYHYCSEKCRDKSPWGK